MFPLLLILTAAFAILTWKNLHAGLLLLVAVLPSYLLRTEILGIPTTLLELLVLTFLVVWLLKRGSEWLRDWRHFPLPIPLFLLASTISVFIAPDLVSALGVWKAYFVEPILLFFVIRHELNTSAQDIKRPYGAFTSSSIFQALGVSAIILSLVAIFQWLTGVGIPIPWDIERRVTSVFDYPNALGLFLGPIFVIAVSSLSKLKSWFWFTTAVLSLVAIVLAQSEASIVSIFATLSIVGTFHAKTRFPTVVGILVVILVVLLSPWRALVIDKLTLQDYSGQVRLSQWSETIDMLGDHWLLGAGLSGYPTVFEPYHQATHLEIFQYPHNIILNIWVELGLLGLIAVGWLVYQVVVSLRGRSPSSTDEAILRRADGLLRSLLLPRNDTGDDRTLGMTQIIAFFALLQMTIHGLVDVPYFKNDLAILTWILLAILFSKDCFAGAPAVAKALVGRRNDTTYVSPKTPATSSR